MVFSPKRLEIPNVSTDDCGGQPPPRQFKLSNGTSTDQVVEEGGTKVIKLVPGQKVGMCSFTSPGTYTLGLKSSPGATLTLIVEG